MVTKSFVKTAISGLHTWALNRFGKLEISEDELLELLSDLDVVQPLSNGDAIYTDNSGKIYIL